MAYLDIYAQFIIFESGATRLVPPHPRPIYGISSALYGYTGFIEPGEVSGPDVVNTLITSLKVKETVTVLRSSDPFSADISRAFLNQLPTIVIVEFDLIDGASIDFYVLGVFQSKITQFESHTPAVASPANAERIVFEFESSDLRFSPGGNPRLSQYGYSRRNRIFEP